MIMNLRHLPWQIQVLILIICLLVLIPNIIKMLRKVPKIITVTLSIVTLLAINLIFIQLGENMGESIGITPKHVGILHYSFAVLLVLTMIFTSIARYQQVKHDEKKRKHFLRQIWGVFTGVILIIIMILL